ncbi:MAG: rod shape-determining protein MreD [Alphaproteobacteria bacterium]|nr:rod shape-determining protein MreD [Alphaproteobacteria bacterium]
MIKGTVWQRLDFVARNLTPLLVSLCLVIISVVPLRLPQISFIVPALALMAVYYWGLHRADLLPAPAIFFIGILQDILSGGAIGVNTLIFLAVYGVCVSQRRFFYGKSFLVVWWGFMVVTAGALALEWALMSVISETIIGPRPAYFKYLATIALYPVVAWMFTRIQRTLPVAE